MSDTNFQPIFDYVDEKIDGLRAEMATKADIQTVLNAIDAFAKDSNNVKQEVVIAQAKTQQIEHWVIKASKKVEVPYNP